MLLLFYDSMLKETGMVNGRPAVRRVESRPASTIEELQDAIAEEWAATDVNFIRKLARSMPKRCQAVIDAEGDHTKY